MTEHTKEPWRHHGTTVILGDNEGGFDIRYCPSPEENARRIVLGKMPQTRAANALAESLEAAGLQASPVACLQTNGMTVWVQCNFQPKEKILRALGSLGINVMDEQSRFPESRFAELHLEGYDIPLIFDVDQRNVREAA
jgi:hypothetical protein